MSFLQNCWEFSGDLGVSGPALSGGGRFQRLENVLERLIKDFLAGMELRQPGCAHQVIVDAARGSTAFRDRPDHQRLAAAHIAGGEDARYRSHAVVVCSDVTASVQLYSELFDHPFPHRPGKAHGEEYKVSIQNEFRTWDRVEFGRRPDLDSVQSLHATTFVAGKLGGRHSPIANSSLFVRALNPHLERPERPGCAGRPLVRGL